MYNNENGMGERRWRDRGDWSKEKQKATETERGKKRQEAGLRKMLWQVMEGANKQSEMRQREKNDHGIKQQHERQWVKEPKGRQREAEKNGAIEKGKRNVEDIDWLKMQVVSGVQLLISNAFWPDRRNQKHLCE